MYCCCGTPTITFGTYTYADTALLCSIFCQAAIKKLGGTLDEEVAELLTQLLRFLPAMRTKRASG